MDAVENLVRDHTAKLEKLYAKFDGKRATLMGRMDRLNEDIAALNQDQSIAVDALVAEFDAALVAAREQDALAMLEPAAPAPAKTKAKAAKKA